MPNFDGTGPLGLGSMTGGGRGFCTMPIGVVRPQVYGRRFFSRGGGRGCRNWYYATGLTGWQRVSLGYPAFGGVPPINSAALSVKEESQILKEEVLALEKQLDDIKQRITILEGQSSKEE
ncbi:MAG: DUF5320 domain-containing protein [Candidatus Omnitrophota bacterium]|nr:DUF5320 domain-containing protein [Candidatus Omnitrophota bacterium]